MHHPRDTTAALLQRRLDAERAGRRRGDFLMCNRFGQSLWLRSPSHPDLQPSGPVILTIFDKHQACLLGVELSDRERPQLGAALWTPMPAVPEVFPEYGEM